MVFVLFLQAEDGIRDLVRSRGLGDVYKRQVFGRSGNSGLVGMSKGATDIVPTVGLSAILSPLALSLIHI